MDQAEPLLAELAAALGEDPQRFARDLARTGDAHGALSALHQLHERAPERFSASMKEAPVRRALLALSGAGPFLARLLTAEARRLETVRRAVSGTPFPWPDPLELVREAGDFEALQQRLRGLKAEVFLHCATRDLGCPEGNLEAATHGLTRLGEVALEAAVAFCRAELAERHGDCLKPDGAPCPVSVIGMGKFGARELNYGSDIDIIVFYGDGGKETTGKRPLDPSEFFARLTRRVVRAVGEQTADGRVFRVDLRLRPEGGSGAVAWSFAAALAYYETLGDTWERAAYIKARTVAGDLDAGSAFLEELAPFVFRRYLDFAALEGLRRVKGRIRAVQRAREQVGVDVKKGRGGIREIEFFAQAQQLIHGGKDPSLQVLTTFDALDGLVAAGHLAPEVCAGLKASYTFLRHVEHRVQLVAEEQTHLLPAAAAGRHRLACQMGHGDAPDPWAAFFERFRAETDSVHRAVDQLFGEPDQQEGGPFEALADQLADLPAEADLSPLRVADEGAARTHLTALGKHIASRWLTEQAQVRWRHLIPLFLADIAAEADPDMGLAGLTRFVEALKGRSIYAAMLNENPDARKLLSRLFCASRFLTAVLARHPALLDELLTPDALLAERTQGALQAELTRMLAGLDEEAWLDQIRRFKFREVLRVGLSELLTGMDDETRGRALARVAEVIVQAVLDHTWDEVTRRHGTPPGPADTPGQVAVVALGRLGGGEMGMASDLDLMFIHNGDEGEETPGPRPVSIPEFYARLGRRMVSKLTLHTGEGVLYEVDMRLRPSGSSGQLVTSLAAFERYQAEQAWTWEKQALTRSRVVAASGAFGAEVAAALVRSTYVPPPAGLAGEVHAMREKMLAHLTERGAGAVESRVDIKQDPGGIVDIEFIVQYLLLAYGHDTPEVIDASPREALRKLARRGLLAQERADRLLAALSLYREVESLLQRVGGEADRVLAETGPPLPGGRERWFERVRIARREVRAVYRDIFGESPA